MPGGRPFREEYMQCMNHFTSAGSARLGDYITAMCASPRGVPKSDINALSTAKVVDRPWIKVRLRACVHAYVRVCVCVRFGCGVRVHL